MRSDTIITRIASSDIYLTFDDGPDAQYTPRILNLLAQNNIKATFFLTGEKVADNRPLVRDMFTAGHCVANHAFSHTRMLFRSSRYVRDEIEKTDSVIADTTGSLPSLFRPPYGHFGPGVLHIVRKQQKKLVLWRVSGRDYERDATPDIIKRRMMRAGNGHIILLHDGHPNSYNTVAALKTYLQEAEQPHNFESLSCLERDIC